MKRMITNPPLFKRGKRGIYARRLRKEMTDSEKKLWSRLRRKQIMDIQFYRQKPKQIPPTPFEKKGGGEASIFNKKLCSHYR